LNSSASFDEMNSMNRVTARVQVTVVHYGPAGHDE